MNIHENVVSLGIAFVIQRPALLSVATTICMCHSNSDGRCKQAMERVNAIPRQRTANAIRYTSTWPPSSSSLHNRTSLARWVHTHVCLELPEMHRDSRNATVSRDWSQLWRTTTREIVFILTESQSLLDYVSHGWRCWTHIKQGNMRARIQSNWPITTETFSVHCTFTTDTFY